MKRSCLANRASRRLWMKDSMLGWATEKRMKDMKMRQNWGPLRSRDNSLLSRRSRNLDNLTWRATNKKQKLRACKCTHSRITRRRHIFRRTKGKQSQPIIISKRQKSSLQHNKLRNGLKQVTNHLMQSCKTHSLSFIYRINRRNKQMM